MRIAQVAPLHESVPPRLYGGTERIVSYLTEALLDLGHDVTLFASGDSRTAARLAAVTPRALRLDARCRDTVAPHVLQLERVAAEAADFDLVHFHLDYLHFPIARRLAAPTVSTFHGRLDLPDAIPLYRAFADLPAISISDAQRRPVPWMSWLGTVYHGLPEDLLSLHRAPGRYLAFLGRISPEKRPDRAVHIARAAGLPLRIAAKIDAADRAYWEARIRPLIDGREVEYVGEIADHEKDEFLGNAWALLFPIDWPEPFGLAMIEALACGTPVIAFRAGSAPEVIEDGRTGFVVESVAEAVAALRCIDRLSREECRRGFEERFSARRMTRDYLSLYRAVAEDPRSPSWRCEPAPTS